MRILVVSWEYPPVVAGGLGRHVGRLSEALAARGADVSVVTRGDGVREDLRGVTVHRVRQPAFAYDDLDAFLGWVERMNADLLAAAVALEGPFDLVHSHDWLVADAGRALALRLDVPWLVTVHATEHGRHGGWVGEHPQRHIHAAERRMVRGADRVITCSEYMRGHVAEVFGVEAAVIANGIDPVAPAPRAGLGRLRARFAAPDERLILLVGRLVHEKGFHLALDAMSRLRGVRFVVAGTGPEEAELKARAARLGLLEHGTFAGWLGDDALHALYRVADLCVVPSLYEPFGLVPLEAMASGCPCIVADTGGLREVVPGVALRFRADDARSLADMAERLLADDGLRERLAAEAAEHMQRFDWAVAARETAAVYEALSGARVS